MGSKETAVSAYSSHREARHSGRGRQQVGMKKFFSLEASNHRPPRLADKIKSEVRKYLKRERSKELPEGVDFWDFDCRQGGSSENAQSLHEKEIGKAIDQALAAEWKGIYLEILAKPGVRTKRER